jgi:RnfABCDGE-type electron transport complex B subunit
MTWTLYPLAFGLSLVAAYVALLLGKSLERHVSVDTKEFELRSSLPGHDCGICGWQDCRAFAHALVHASGDPGRCFPGGPELEAKLRAKLGDQRSIRRVAVITCASTATQARSLFAYEGARDCRSAIAIHGGPKACGEACIGLGSCLRFCPLEAITLKDGLAAVLPDRCSGCGACLSSCPVAAITLIPRENPWYVACNSHKSPESKQRVCDVSCTACRRCERATDLRQFMVEGNMARFIGPSDRHTREISQSCPTGAIRQAVSSKRSAATS